MAITIQTLCNATADIYRLKMIAGKEGAGRLVSWMYYTEDVSTLDFLRGGELVITTGLEIERRAGNEGVAPESFMIEYLSLLIDAITSQNASGIILNIGKYIKTIPEEIIQLCDRLQLPLMTMPWEIHIIDLMQDYGNRIVSDRQKVHTLEKTLFNVLFKPEEYKSEGLENTAFLGAEKYSLILLELPESLAQEEAKCRRYMDCSFNSKTGLRGGDYAYILYENKIIYIFHEDAHVYLKQIDHVVRKNSFFQDMKLSLSGVCSQIQDLAAEYRHADLALKFCDETTLIGDYENIGIFSLLGEVQDRKLLEKFYDSILGPLNVFGKDKLDDYLNTLRLYLCYGGKVLKTAEKNYTHRNTVNYRIRKICDLLNIDLADGEKRFMIQTALYVRDLLNKN